MALYMQKFEFIEKARPYKEFIDFTIKEWLTQKNLNNKHLLKKALFPGRRMRPILLLMLLTSENELKAFCDSNPKYLNDCIILELLHRASIIVDDIVDNDTQRRNESTYHILYGLSNAILISHLLVSEATKLLSNASELTAINFNQVYNDMCKGQMADIRHDKTLNSGWDVYYYQVLKKTNSLFELLFSVAARRNNKDNLKFNPSSIGRIFGNIYQMSNDFYDSKSSIIKSRGDKTKYTLNFNLLVSIGMDFDPTIKRLVNNKIGKTFTQQEYYSVVNQIYSPEISNISLRKIEEEISKLKNELRSAPKHWTSIINDLCKLINNSVCWDHKEISRVGY